VVEDGAPVHMIKKLAADRAQACIVNVKHPGSSPDLNAIESCWAYVKDRLRRLPGKTSTMDALWEAIQKAWDEMPQHIVDGFVGRFEKGREHLLSAHGGHTQF
jgi:hypothetical protein